MTGSDARSTGPRRPRAGATRRGKRRLRSRLPALVAVAALVALAALAGCGGGGGGSSPSASASATAASGASTLTQAEKDYLAQKGTLQVGGFTDYPPFGFVDANGQAAGLSVDYWKLVAERLGVQVEFTPEVFAAQIDGLKQGRFDSLEGIFPLPERKQWFAFSRPWFEIDTRIYTDAAHADATTLKSLKGLTVAVVKEDSGQAIADKAGLKTLVVLGYPQAVRAVADGKAQAMILDELVAGYYIKKFGATTKVQAVGKPVAIGMMTFPVQKADTTLLAILNKGIAMVGDSEFEGIYEKWTAK